MESNLLKEEIKKIKIPREMRERILKNCRNAGEEKKESIFMAKTDLENGADVEKDFIRYNANEKNSQKKGRSISGRKWTRLATVAAAVAVCLGLGGVSAMAASGKLEGFFADVTRWDGAVVGTTYEQATEEIEVSASVNGESIIVDAALLKAGEAPYVAIDSLGIQIYQIHDKGGNVIVEGNLLEATDIAGGKVSMKLPVGELESGSYTLIITEFVGKSKADQDLPIRGYWVCEFAL